MIDLDSIEHFAQQNEYKSCIIRVVDSVKSTFTSEVDFSHFDTEDKHLHALKILSYYHCNILCVDAIHYYVRVGFMKCLKMLLIIDEFTSLCIKICGLHYCNSMVLQLVEASEYSIILLSFCPYKFPLPFDATLIWEDIVCGIGKMCPEILEDHIRKITPEQHKLLIQISLKHKHVYTLHLVKLIMTKDDHHKLWLLKEFCRMTNLQDVYAGCILFYLFNIDC